MRPADPTPEDDFARFREHGDGLALARVFDRLAPELLLLAAHLAPRHDEAEDLVQATFLDAIRNAGRWDRSRRLLPWLVGILGNHASNSRRRARPQPSLEDVEPAESTTPRDEAEQREFAAAFEKALATLPSPYKQAVTLRLVHGLGPGEIAHALGCPVATVKTRLQRGLEALRNVLPVGFTAGGLVLVTPARGLAAVREAVLAEAGVHVPVAAATLVVGVGGAIAMKKVLVVSAVTVLAAGAWWAGSRMLGGPGAEPESRASAAASAASPAATAGAAAPSASRASAPAELQRTAVASDEAKTGALELELVWKEDGSPAMYVRVWDRFGPMVEATPHRAGADGRLILAALAPGAHRIDTFPDQTPVTIRAGETTRLRVALAGSVLVRGTVVDGGDRPVEGAEVWVGWDAVDWADARHRRIATSARDGSFRARASELSVLWARKRGFQPSQTFRFEEQDHTGKAKDSDRPFVLVLQGGGETVSGRVLDPRGAAVAGALVAITVDERLERPAPSADGHEVQRPLPILLTSDDRGGFASDEVPAGARTVWARANGFAAGSTRIEVEPGDPLACTVSLRRGATVFGRAADAQGRPVEGVEVTARVKRTVWGVNAATRDALLHGHAATDADGRFRLEGVSPEQNFFLAKAERGRELHRELMLEDGQEVEWNLVIEPELSIRGRLLDPEGKGVAGWRVSARDWDVRREYLLSQEARSQMATTDAQGRFVFEHLADIGYRLTAQPDRASGAAGLVTWIRRESVRPGPDEVVLRLEHDPTRPCFITGSIVAAPGQLTPKASVSVYPSDPGRGFALPTEGLAAGEGSFRIGPLPPDSYRVLIDPEQFGRIDLGKRMVRAGETLELGEIRLDLLVTITVRLARGDGVALGEAHVKLVSATGEPWLSRQADGSYRSQPIVPGSYDLRAFGKDFLPLTRRVEVGAGQALPLDVEVDPCPEVRFEFVPTDRVRERWVDALQLVVRDATGTELDRGMIQVDGKSTFEWSRAYGYGAFTLTAICHGTQLQGEARFAVARGEPGPVKVRVALGPKR